MSTAEIFDPFEIRGLEEEHALSLLADEPSPSPLERWFSWALLLATLAAVLICDIQIVYDAPNYFPDNEANRVALLQHVADHGTPPVLGRDSFMVDPTVPVPPNTTVIHRFIQGQSPTIGINTAYPQVLALDPPYPYYLSVPVSWVVPWNHRVLALRLLSMLLACAAIVFLWAAVRVAWPANPVAAGLSAVILGTMSGLVEAYTAYQPSAIMFAAWCAGMRLVLRDARRRRCSVLTVATVTVATCANPIALPAALAAVIVLSVRAGDGRQRRSLLRVVVVLIPTIAWVVWNLHAYGDPWPLNVSATPGQPDRARDWRALTSGIAPISSVSESLFDQFYASGGSPFRHGDQRPESFVALLFVGAMAWALWSGRIVRAQLALARFGPLMLGSFFSIYGVSFLASVVAAGPMDFLESNYGGFAAGWAGVAGIGLTAPLAGHRRIQLVGVSLVSLVLLGIMLRAPNL